MHGHTLTPATLLCSLIWMALPLSSPVHSQAVAVEDSYGRDVRLEAPARRIVALAPHLVENLFSAGAGERLVGTVSYSDYPDAARDIPRVGSYNAYSLETIASLQPDLIVMWGSGNGMRTLEKLALLEVPVYVSELRALDDIPRDIHRLGILAGSETVAAREARRIEQSLALLRSRYASLQSLQVLYQIWNEPLQTINGDHLISQVIELCGGNNIFADLPNLAPRVSIESVLARKPQAIFASGRADQRPQWLDDWRRYPELPAVSSNGLFFIDPDLLERPTARVLLGARTLCEQLDGLRAEPSE